MTNDAQEGTGGLNELAPSQPFPLKHTMMNTTTSQSSTRSGQGATGDPGVLQSQSQPDGVLWRVSENAGSVWAGAGSHFCFLPSWTDPFNPPLLWTRFPNL